MADLVFYEKALRSCLKDKIRSENLINAEAIPDYYEQIPSVLLRNYPKSFLIIRICFRWCVFKHVLSMPDSG
ncbi:hypothetical protein PEDI_35320 [Persicobacter diffluens]|uniref:Uncharacterized protein n=1 Tax=Persicobacter diffluens TaxID=981 RepID=A0AAN5AKL3_9BACT|nr:hypothetical protein PEDI_35320 [Persicobacter diffluens]